MILRRQTLAKKLPPSRRSKVVFNPNEPETKRKRRDTAKDVKAGYAGKSSPMATGLKPCAFAWYANASFAGGNPEAYEPKKLTTLHAPPRIERFPLVPPDRTGNNRD